MAWFSVARVTGLSGGRTLILNCRLLTVNLRALQLEAEKCIREIRSEDLMCD